VDADVTPPLPQSKAVATSSFAPQLRTATGAVAMRPARLQQMQPLEMAVKKKSVSDLGDAELKGKNVLIRCDLNVPLDGKTITDDTRIRASVETIKYLVSKGARVAVTSHLGRPKSGPEDKFSLGPAGLRLTELLGQEVKMQKDCIGDEVGANVKAMKDGDVILLENSRFYKEEEKNDTEFAKKMAAPFDVFVNDAFGTAHRAHASTQGVTAFLKTSVAGFLLQKELDYLGGAVDEPKRPFAAIVGGSKVSSKIGVIDSLMGKCDKIIIGGGMVRLTTIFPPPYNFPPPLSPHYLIFSHHFPSTPMGVHGANTPPQTPI